MTGEAGDRDFDGGGCEGPEADGAIATEVLDATEGKVATVGDATRVEDGAPEELAMVKIDGVSRLEQMPRSDCRWPNQQIY